MRIENFLENRQILNYHCSDHRSKVFVEQQLFSIRFRHNGLGKHTLYPGTKKVNICYIVLLNSSVIEKVCLIIDLKAMVVTGAFLSSMGSGCAVSGKNEANVLFP